MGLDLVDIKAKKVLVVTDPTLKDLPPVHTVLESLSHHKVRVDSLKINDGMLHYLNFLTLFRFPSLFLTECM